VPHCLAWKEICPEVTSGQRSGSVTLGFDADAHTDGRSGRSI